MAQQTITIRVNGKHAETDFHDIVSFNENSYRLHFEFDGEWDDYSQRVAVVLWAGGCREQLFTGSSCDMPAVLSSDCDTAFVGVYSADGEGGRIASSFVRLRCLAGAYCEPEELPQKTLHEQILDLLNEYDFSALTRKVDPGCYSAVDVNAYGFVTGGKQIVEVGAEGQAQPSASLADGGLFFKQEEGGYTLCYFSGGELEPISGLAGGSGGGGAVTSVNGQTGAVTIGKYDLGLAAVAISGSYNDLEDKPAAGAVTSVNGQTGAVTIGKYDLGLAAVAISGSYNDLEDKPAAGAVTSVNGQTGAVTIGKYELGLASVAISGSYNDLVNVPPTGVSSVNGQKGAVTLGKGDLGLGLVENARQLSIGGLVREGANFNALGLTGCYFVVGSSGHACTNCPTASASTAQNCHWFLMTFNFDDEDEYIAQVAVSFHSDAALCVRSKSGGSWSAWRSLS